MAEPPAPSTQREAGWKTDSYLELEGDRGPTPETLKF